MRRSAISGVIMLLSATLLAGCQARSTMRGGTPTTATIECRVEGIQLLPGETLECGPAGRIAVRSDSRTLEGREVDGRRGAAGADARGCRIGGFKPEVGTRIECLRDGQFAIHAPGQAAQTGRSGGAAAPPARAPASPAPPSPPAAPPAGFLGALLR